MPPRKVEIGLVFPARSAIAVEECSLALSSIELLRSRRKKWGTVLRNNGGARENLFVKFLLNPFLFARPEINFKPLCQQRERVEPGYLIT